MGKSAHRRIIRKIDLEIFLSQITPFPNPKVNLEQYLISANVAATMLHTAAYCNDDIIGRTVLDLGCGTGRLSLGAAFLGACTVLGIDLDKEAIRSAFENAQRMELRQKTQWITGDIKIVNGRFDTVIQNPPFGVQKRNADRSFLEKALEVGETIYSLHNHPIIDDHLMKELKNAPSRILQISPSPFLQEYIDHLGGSIESVYAMPMFIPHYFTFHQKARHEIIVDFYIIRNKRKENHHSILNI
jgi:putative methylase